MHQNVATTDRLTSMQSPAQKWRGFCFFASRPVPQNEIRAARRALGENWLANLPQ
jgi:hypothetical protein